MIEHPFWWDTLPPLPEPPAAESRIAGPNTDRRCDVAVIGAGYTGLAAARQLAGAGASVIVFDRERIGWGASSRNGGQVLTGLKVDPAALVASVGESRARRLFEAATESIARLETLIGEESIDCDYRRCGHLQAASKPAHFDALRDEQALLARVFGHRVELVPRARQRAEIGADVYHGVLVDERSASLNPARYVHGLAAAAGRRGARLAAGVAVTRLRRGPGGWRLATTAGEVEAADVIVGTNGYTGGVTPALQRRLVPIGSYIVVTEPLAEDEAAALLPRRRVAFDSRRFLVYFSLTADNRLLFGGRAAFSPPTPEATRRAAAILQRQLASVFPPLAGKSIEYAWSGAVAFTRDQLPHAGKLDGMYFAAGYCGHGIAMATSLGEAVARRLAGEPVHHPFVDSALPPIPLYRGRPWFLPLVGLYYRVLDFFS